MRISILGKYLASIRLSVISLVPVRIAHSTYGPRKVQFFQNWNDDSRVHNFVKRIMKKRSPGIYSRLEERGSVFSNVSASYENNGNFLNEYGETDAVFFEIDVNFYFDSYLSFEEIEKLQVESFLSEVKENEEFQILSSVMLKVEYECSIYEDIDSEGNIKKEKFHECRIRTILFDSENYPSDDDHF